MINGILIRILPSDATVTNRNYIPIHQLMIRTFRPIDGIVIETCRVHRLQIQKYLTH